MSRNNGESSNQGANGYYWTNVANSAYLAQELDFSNLNLRPWNNYYKLPGMSVRCVAQKIKKTILLQLFPFSLPYSGRVDNVSGAFSGMGNFGGFWSTGANSTTNARDLSIYEEKFVYPEASLYKAYGLPVRCVAKKQKKQKNKSLHKFPFSLPYSGDVGRNTGTFDRQNANGYFWSGGAIDASGSRDLELGNSNNTIWPERNSVKANGFSVRCVAKKQYPPHHSHSRFRTQAL